MSIDLAFQNIIFIYIFCEVFMKKSIGIWSLWGFGVTALLGTLLHFLYEWTGESVLAALFSAVNESTWEHMKLLFVPTFIFAIVQSIYFKDEPNFWCVKLRGTVLGLILIPILFYTYNGVIGKSENWINIAIFFISAAVGYFYEFRAFKSGDVVCRAPKRALFAFCFILALFVLFTFRTPEIGIFKDPLSGVVGI